MDKFILVFLVLIPSLVTAADSNWKSKAFYQVFIDRFAIGDGSRPTCSDLNGYCGGNFKGLEKNLNYIKDLGFDVLWLSDVLTQADGEPAIGNPVDYFQINSKYGSADDLRSLVRACHSAGMKVVVDVNLNSAGQVASVQTVVPFNLPEYYHTYCPVDFKNATSIERCWYMDKPDLAQEQAFVRSTLLQWVSWIDGEFGVDGVNFLETQFVPISFWSELNQGVKGLTMGAVYSAAIDTNAKYQGALDTVVNHPLNYFVNTIFIRKLNMGYIQRFIDEMAAFYDEQLLINFLSGMNYPRFLSLTTNVQVFRNAAAFTLLYTGIPSIYYGEEQSFTGGQFPENSSPLWSHMNPDSDTYKWFAKLMKFRKVNELWSHDWVERAAGTNFIAATKGSTIIVLTNDDTEHSMTLSDLSFFETEEFCNVLASADCISVTDGKLLLSIQGEPKLYQRKSLQLITS